MSRFSSGINPALLKRLGITLSDSEKMKGKPSKYGNRRTEYAGRTYASKLEAECAAQLDLLKRAGLVTKWASQVPCEVGPKITYIADFLVWYAKGQPRTIDAKGLETPVFKLKRKLFESLYGPLDVVKRATDVPTEGR